ncbi:MAG: hypothetical protein RBR22_13850 [Desulfuromonas sp.]|nr:hypothetical protein [Desulfuromonas sp.]
MIRRSVHAIKKDRFSKLAESRHKSFIAEIKSEVDNVVVKRLKGAILIDDLRVKLFPARPLDIDASWVNALFEANVNEWGAMAWLDSDGGWIIKLSLLRLDSNAKGGLNHNVTMNMATFALWLRSQQW